MTYQLLLSMAYHWYCLGRINFKSVREKTDCTDLWVIKLTNQVSPSSGFRVPHWIQTESEQNCIRLCSSTLISSNSLKYFSVYILLPSHFRGSKRLSSINKFKDIFSLDLYVGGGVCRGIIWLLMINPLECFFRHQRPSSSGTR